MSKRLYPSSIVDLSHYLIQICEKTKPNEDIPKGRVFIASRHLMNGKRWVWGDLNLLNPVLHERGRFVSFDPKGIDIFLFASSNPESYLQFKADGEGMFDVDVSCKQNHVGQFLRWFKKQ